VDISIPWATDAAQERVTQIQAGSEPGTAADLERAHRAVLAHRRRMDGCGLVLYAGSNTLSARVAAAHDPAVGIRPSLGDPGEKIQPGLEDLEVLEVLTTRVVAATMGAAHADVRVQSATLANLAVYAGLTPVGSTIAALPRWAGGHFSHHPEGAAGIRGHRVVELPYDAAAYDVDLEALPDFLARESPSLVVLGGALMLFPHRLVPIVERVQDAGARVLYDASHVAGLIAGGRFQDPLAEGVDVVTFSTYKSYGGPPGGAIVTNDPDVAERVFASVYPGLTANYDGGRLRGLGLAAAELLDGGAEYADRCIEAARALANALADAGLIVVGSGRGYTESHHVAVALPDAMTGDWAVGRLARAGVYLSATQVPSAHGPVAALRLGTQELVTRGFGPRDFGTIAQLVERALSDREPPAELRAAAETIRHAVRSRFGASAEVGGSGRP
jgi:glycine hydroxymethyltransferase